MSILGRLKSQAVRLAGPLGLNALAWQLTRRRPRIFMYHRFAATDSGHRIGRESFRRQLRAIQQRCRIVTLAELARTLRHDPEEAAGLAVITVDDGYRDFHEHAWPVLRKEGVPATFFPVTGFIERQTWLWPDLVEHLLEVTGNPDRQRWQEIIDHAIDLPDADKWAYLKSLYAEAGIAWPQGIPDDYAPVTWDELRELAAAGIEIGAHTQTHCRLTRVDDAQLVRELAGARAKLEFELRQPVVSLCYPNGAPADYDERVMHAAESHGYIAAVAAHFDGSQGGLYDLRRQAAGPDWHGFQKSLHGVDELSKRLAGDRA